ncbi:2-amino-4-hydroxy-6-hydroxymethyldihydropteridine diphosphokinase [Tissierella creatinophila]|uniref:2-amino-4-hydroxy-6-hydroxymethyldihydropteridine diphosphokinase n=1 Tax=Tissierella creatinophila DSM 6911 TaxID=1123403 RepID=A0A1U7M3K9_TISCR|nr:2-amino-4-hydroxy-6-hydroxymethyldihydropteridine diphosphokinase [Tissierella creatinophila]OLS01903.1 2-amino-4-hydroxy-6-hydroxymethyldihydropteridine pyrophosphokinase [Tissierella creatinophila DSM 6911]
MNKVYLGLGSNIGDSKRNIESALLLLSKKVNILNKSSYYETEPVGFKDQPWFLNMVIEGETSLNPRELLDFTQSIERDMKRVKTIVNGPRIIDVDILIYGDIKMESENLIIPHPRMHERAFVMVPMFELAPKLVINNIPIGDIMKNFKGEEIRKVVD